MTSWDPLEAAGDASSEIVTAARKREIRNILKSYVGFYDPLSEMIQNAMDAADLRRTKLKESDYIGKISILLDLENNGISVTDNGIGFKADQFRLFLTPSISFKTEGDTRGNKGVGATYLAYGFNYLQLGTKTPEHTSVYEICDGREWVEDHGATVGRPQVSESTSIHDAFDGIDRGSTFTLRLAGDHIRPKDMSWIGATDADQWRTILLIRTPLGSVHRGGGGDSEIIFDLVVVDKDGKKTQLLDQKCQYIFPDAVIKSCFQVADIRKAQQALIDKGKDASKLPAKYKKLNAVYEYWDEARLHELVKNTEEQELVSTYGIWAYGFFCYSAPRVLDKFNDETARLRKGLRILRGGLQLATNHMTQGELITIPLTSNIGYQNQAHVIVHLTNAEPDLGRKGFQPELQQLAEKISVSIVGQLKQWRHLLRKDTGGGAVHVDELKLDDWINSQKEFEQEHPINLQNENFFIPINDISITACPNSEQDVVALFNQLIAGGVVRGIRVMATSSHNQYDGLFRYHLIEPLDNHEYDAETNPLGIDDAAYDEGFVSKPYVLEYKFNFDRLIEDIENEEKKDSDIDLVVVWEMGSRWRERYEAVSLLIDDNRHLRHFHGVTHELHDDNTGDRRLDVVVLSELLDYLNDQDAAEEAQVLQYGEDEVVE